MSLLGLALLLLQQPVLRAQGPTLRNVSNPALSSGKVSNVDGIWAFFCYEDTASIDGTKPTGYYSNECWRQGTENPSPMAKGWMLMVKWSRVEPKDGEFDWSELDANITKAAQHGLAIQIMVEICKGDPKDPATPAWLYDIAPRVRFDNSGIGPTNISCPYYLDGVFQQRFGRLIDTLSAHLQSLDHDVRKNVLSVQAAFGITGDDRPWAGTPLNSSLEISPADWRNYTRTFARRYIAAFTGTDFALLFNLENPSVYVNQSDDKWAIELMEQAGVTPMVKQGIVSHGYSLNTEYDLYGDFAVPVLLTPRKDGSYISARGELAVEPDPNPGKYGNWRASPWWSLQANAEWALTFGLNVWNLYAGFLGNATFFPTCEFFNRHAGQKDVSRTTAAFISFRDSLRTEDLDRFPESVFGPLHDSHHADQLNVDRMVAIANASARYGARQDDPKAGHIRKSVAQKKASALNDVCWNCWRGNYGRYITQMRANETTVGRWRVGPKNEPYGRYARSFEHATNRTRIMLDVADGFGAALVQGAGDRPATVRVAYFDQGNGRWRLSWDNAGTMETLLEVSKKNSGHWQIAEANFTIPKNGLRNGGPSGEDMALESLDGEDDVFSLIELLLTPGLNVV